MLISDICERILLGYVIITSLGWVISYARSMWGAASFPLLDDLDTAQPDDWPSVSIIVPACNEGETIEPALRSLLDVDYPKLEIIAVDDRSDDDTGAIIDRIAAEDDRVRPLHVEQLPDGWLGKTHALQRGTEVATGEWLLFTDADVHFAPDALRRAVAAAVSVETDHLTLVPYVHTSGLLGCALYETFGILMLLSMRLDKVADPDDDAFMGVGAFNLVRADTLDAGRGFEHIRMEIADDFGLALLVNQVNGRTAAAYAPKALDLEWYPSLGAMIRGLRKNAFAVMCRFSYLRAAAMIVVGLLFVLGPFVGIALGIVLPELAGWAWLSSGAALAALGAQSVFYHRTWGRPLVAQLLVPVGQLLTLWAIARSAGHYWRTGGVDWRGTHYDIDELRENQRVQI
jgi:glycosyltransferase involved in cell wall biosynthesis